MICGLPRGRIDVQSEIVRWHADVLHLSIRQTTARHRVLKGDVLVVGTKGQRRRSPWRTQTDGRRAGDRGRPCRMQFRQNVVIRIRLKPAIGRRDARPSRRIQSPHGRLNLVDVKTNGCRRCRIGERHCARLAIDRQHRLPLQHQLGEPAVSSARDRLHAESLAGCEAGHGRGIDIGKARTNRTFIGVDRGRVDQIPRGSDRRRAAGKH